MLRIRIYLFKFIYINKFLKYNSKFIFIQFSLFKWEKIFVMSSVYAIKILKY